jgi:RNA polymerase sporulation-specific sigma factor
VETFLSPLSVAEEKECLIRMKNGDPSAREELILHNMRLVAHVAKRYLSSEENPEDLISIGTIGLIKAVSTFDREYGSRFATYAIRCIDNEMLMYFRSRKKQKGEVSLYEPIGTDKEGNQIHLFDVLESEDIDVAESLEQKRQIDRIRKHMNEVLTPREFEIIEKRYGLFGQREQTQREIAIATGISRSYVSRMEKKALQKLKNFLQE